VREHELSELPDGAPSSANFHASTSPDTTISARRFFCLPAGVALSAAGLVPRGAAWPGWGGGWYGRGMSSTMTYGSISTMYVGQLDLIIYDPKTKQLVWRGVAPPKRWIQKRKSTLNKAVTKLLKNFRRHLQRNSAVNIPARPRTHSVRIELIEAVRIISLCDVKSGVLRDDLHRVQRGDRGINFCYGKFSVKSAS
jgi:hypothetical protein